MAEYKFKACVIGALSTRQKIMMTRLLRESKEKIVAMDEYNAKTQELSKKAEFLIVFSVGNQLEDSDYFDRMIKDGWSLNRFKVEGEDFEIGQLPKF